MRITLLLITLFSISAHSNVNKSLKKKVKYRTFFGKCPSKVVGKLTIGLVREFERNLSLKDVKEKIIKERVVEKHFLSRYDIDYNPLTRFLKFSFDCPSPLLRVQIYKKNGFDYYNAILVDNGELFDPTYEVLLKSEKKLSHNLPSLALPIGDLKKETQMRITSLVKNISLEFRKKISEIILNDNKSLTFILSVRGRPSSVFLGSDDWEEKVEKLTKIIGYMSKRKKVPAIINLTNPKKVVVKFTSRI
jgi:hypothetical protein